MDGKLSVDKKLIEVVDTCDTKKVKMLLKAGAKIEHEDIYGNVALIRASMYGRTEIVKLLLEMMAPTLKNRIYMAAPP